MLNNKWNALVNYDIAIHLHILQLLKIMYTESTIRCGTICVAMLSVKANIKYDKNVKQTYMNKKITQTC